MKKFLSIAAVLVMVFALAAPAFAADASVNIQGSKITTENVDVISKPEGSTLTVEPVKVDSLKEADKEALVAAAKANSDGDVAVVELVEVTLTGADGKEITELGPNGELKVAVAYVTEGNQTVLQVLSQKEDGTWEKVKDFSYDKATGKLEITFDHLCAVAFVVGEAPAPANPGTNTGTNTNTNTNTRPNRSSSPQTGYNTAGWLAAAMAMILGAGFCFISARKKTNA